MREIESRRAPQRTIQTTTNVAEQDMTPPPDDYQLLPIVPDVREILSEQPPYLRRNIVDGAYEDPRHYLDVSIDSLPADISSMISMRHRFTFDCYAKTSSVHYVKAFNSTVRVRREKISTCASMRRSILSVQDCPSAVVLSTISAWTK